MTALAVVVACVPATIGLTVSVVPGETFITDPDRQAGDGFGHAIAADGAHILIGVRDANDHHINSGAAFLARPDGSGGYDLTRFTASDATPHMLFGGSVAIEGDRLLVGAYGAGNLQGAAYLFEPDGLGGWTERKFLASDGQGGNVRGHGFGGSVALDGHRIVVGAPGVDAYTGAAYVYEQVAPDVWTETRLMATDGQEDAWYGWRVGIDGDKVVVGALGQDGGRGAVYVYERGGAGEWVETKLQPAAVQPFDRFGVGLAIHGGRVLVGSLAYRDLGSAFLFEQDEAGLWVETELAVPGRSEGHYYGFGVALHGDRALVGALGDFGGTGASYLWEEDDGWTPTTIRSSIQDQESVFGYSVALLTDGVAVAAPGVLDVRGGVFMFDVACGDHDTLAAIGSVSSGCRDVV